MDEESGPVEVKGHSGMAAVMARLLSGGVHHESDDRSTLQDESSSGQDNSSVVRNAKRSKTHTNIDDIDMTSLGSSVKKRKRHGDDVVTLSEVVKKYHQLPGDMNYEEERELQRVATKGVVTLFNAVSRQQKELESKLKEVGPSEGKQSKVLRTSIDKGSFIELLKTGGGGTTSSTTAKKKTNPPSDELSSDQPSWAILRDDYMKKSKLKDWDTRTNELDSGTVNNDLPTSESSDED